LSSGGGGLAAKVATAAPSAAMTMEIFGHRVMVEKKGFGASG
jgi:hypothetical protein